MQYGSSEGTPPFRIVVFVLFSIVMACGIFIGLSVKGIPPLAGGIALLAWVVLPHAYGLALSIHHRHTEAAVVISLFLGFWIYLGVGMIANAPGLTAALVFIEPPIFCSVYVMAYFYGRIDTTLRAILIGLGSTVLFLWCTKLISALHVATPYVVGALGFWVLAEAAYLLAKHQRPTY